MAIVFDGPVTPAALTTVIRQTPTPSTFRLNEILPDRMFDRNTIEFSELTRTNRVAKYRAYDGRIHVSERDTMIDKSVKLPPLSTSSPAKGELERLQLEFARNQGGNRAVIINAIYDDATNLAREVRARAELARGDVLTDGKFTLTDEGGLTLEADYSVPAGNLVTAGTVWSTVASATPISDLVSWVATYVAVNGSRPGGFICSETILGYLLRNAEIRTLASTMSGAPARVTPTNLAGVLADFNLPPLLFTYDTQVSVDGTDTRVTPVDRLIMVPPNPTDLGYFAWGVSATALELVNAHQVDFAFSDAPGIVGVVEKVGPPYRESVFVDAVGMPVLTNPKLLMVADVA